MVLFEAEFEFLVSLYKIIKVQPTKYRNTGLGGVWLFVSFVVICLFVLIFSVVHICLGQLGSVILPALLRLQTGRHGVSLQKVLSQ